jgi:hypothetical protein
MASINLECYRRQGTSCFTTHRSDSRASAATISFRLTNLL